MRIPIIMIMLLLFFLTLGASKTIAAEKKTKCSCSDCQNDEKKDTEEGGKSSTSDTVHKLNHAHNHSEGEEDCAGCNEYFSALWRSELAADWLKSKGYKVFAIFIILISYRMLRPERLLKKRGLKKND